METTGLVKGFPNEQGNENGYQRSEILMEESNESSAPGISTGTSHVYNIYKQHARSGEQLHESVCR